MADKPHNSSYLYEFGEFRLDSSERTLRRSGEMIVLPPRVFDTLNLLVQRNGTVISKQEMMDSIWPDAFVEEANLTQNIYLLRKTLGKTPNEKDWIETLPRKGYIFSGNVELLGPEIPDADGTGEAAAVVPVPTRRFRFAVGIIGLVLFAGLATGAYFISRRETGGPTEKKPAFRKLTAAGNAEFPVISPDGRSFGFVREGYLYVQPIDKDEPKLIKLPENTKCGFIQFTPDGRSIAFRAESRFVMGGDIYEIGIGGGEPRVIARNVWSGISFSRDGKQAAFIRDQRESNRHSIVIQNLATGAERELASVADPASYVLFSAPAWSPDGSKIVVSTISRESQAPRSQLVVYDTATGAAQEFAPRPLRRFDQAAWLPDGTAILAIAREAQTYFQIWKISYPDGRLSRVTNDNNIYRSLSISADGRRIISGDYTTFSHVWTASAANFNAQKQITFGNLSRDGILGMQWTPDGGLIYSSRVFGSVDLWKSGPGELDRAQLTKEAGDVNGNPALAPDGKTLYFTSTRTGSSQIWRMDMSGGSQTQITFGDKENNTQPQISPDGQTLYYFRRSRDGSTVMRLTIATNETHPVENIGPIAPDRLVISPDGLFLAACEIKGRSEDSEEGGQIQYTIIQIGGGEPRSLKLPTEQFTWSPDSKSLDYAENAGGEARILRQSLDGGPPTVLYTEKAATINGLSWNRDGSSLAISKGRRLYDVVSISEF
ncbi:MAG: winged helix-turn-helix domain-containing protein [Pyrinomonadaceae bacterium]